jgi:hypothetical protein
MNAPAPSQHTTGLFPKFNVSRVDGRDQPGEKHHGADYFVLDLTDDPHAIPALTAYAESCAADYPQLAADLQRKIATKIAAASEFVTVPETTLPNGLVVPAFRVGRYFAGRGPAGIPVSTPTATPWVDISYHEAREACAKANELDIDHAQIKRDVQKSLKPAPKKSKKTTAKPAATPSPAAQAADLSASKKPAAPAQETNADEKPGGEADPAPASPGNEKPAAKPPTTPKPGQMFCHPDNPDLKWSGKGRAPAWAKALMDAGRGLECAE